jgi:RHS repeat-associated protein
LQFANGNTIDYVYDAAGQKLSVTHRTAVTGVVIPMTGVTPPLAPAQIFSELTTDYCGNVMYEDGELSRILTEEGYVTLTGNGNNAFPAYHYYLKDHQGNNRVVIDQAGTVEQVNHYYPFGGLFGEGLQTSNQPYRYNGKELDRQLSLDLYDYGARHYDAALGRWLTVDPMAEKYYSISSYAYCGNNPVNRIDPDGMSYDWVENRDKHIYWDKNAISQATTKKGETYIGKTVYATNADGSFRYGDQFGNWHNSAPLGEVTVRGFQTSGSGPVSAAIRQAAGGYDPKWIAGFNKFVEGGLKAIELTLTFATLAHDLNNLGGSGIRAGVNLIDDAAKGGSKVPNFIVSKGGTVFPVPRGATGPIPASSGKGFQFIKGVGDKGLSPKAMGFRFMDPITTGKYQYPGGYGSYFNKAGQTINPFTGQTISPSNPWWHIPAK